MPMEHCRQRFLSQETLLVARALERERRMRRSRSRVEFVKLSAADQNSGHFPYRDRMQTDQFLGSNACSLFVLMFSACSNRAAPSNFADSAVPLDGYQDHVAGSAIASESRS
jgi:hypothetical protein